VFAGALISTNSPLPTMTMFMSTSALEFGTNSNQDRFLSKTPTDGAHSPSAEFSKGFFIQ
jgi:hypothetical protein